MQLAWYIYLSIKGGCGQKNEKIENSHSGQFRPIKAVSGQVNCFLKLVSILHVCTQSLCIHRITQKPKTYGQQKYIIQSSNFRFVFSMCCLIAQKQRQNQ